MIDPEMFKTLNNVHGEILNLIMGQLQSPVVCDEDKVRIQIREIGERLIEASMTE